MAIEFVALTIGGHYVQLRKHFDDAEPHLFALGTGVGASTVFRRHELPGARSGSQSVAFSTDRGLFLTTLPSVDFVTAGSTAIGPSRPSRRRGCPTTGSRCARPRVASSAPRAGAATRW